MELRITRPMVFSDDSGMRSFVPNLAVEVDATTAEQILAQRRVPDAAAKALTRTAFVRRRRTSFIGQALSSSAVTQSASRPWLRKQQKVAPRLGMASTVRSVALREYQRQMERALREIQ